MDTNPETIKVWVEAPQETGTKSALPGLVRHAAGKTLELAEDTFRESIKNFAAKFTHLLDGQPLKEGEKVVIDEVELSLVITAAGGIELLGKATVGAQAGIKIKLKRQV